MIYFLLAAVAIAGAPPSPHPTLSPSLRFDSAIRACSDTDGLAWALNSDRGTGVVYSASHQMDACVNGARVGRWTSTGLDVTGSFTVNGGPPPTAFPLKAPDGSAAAPRYSFSGDATMGMSRGFDPVYPTFHALLLEGGADLTVHLENYATATTFDAAAFVIRLQPSATVGFAGADVFSSTLTGPVVSHNGAAATALAIDTTGGAAGAVLFRDSATGSFKSFPTFTFDGVGSLDVNTANTSGAPSTGTATTDGRVFLSHRGGTSTNTGGAFVQNTSILGGQGALELVGYQDANSITGTISFFTGTSTNPVSATKRAEFTDNGGFGMFEQNAPIPGEAGAPTTLIYVDSTSRTLKLRNAGDAYDDVARSTSSVAAGDTTESAGTLTTATTTTLQIGNYQCHGSVVLSESVSAEGAKCALTKLSGNLSSRSQGSAILTSTTANTGDAAVDHGASLNPSVSLSVFPAGTCIVDAFLSASSQPTTVALQIAQNAHTTGTITGFAGANLLCTRM